MGQVYLKPGKEKRVCLGHPWIFLSDIDRADRSVSPGDTVTVCTKQGKFLARAVYNPKSQIALRILSIYDEAIDDYHREPYVSDVSEGKNDPIYNAHSYHTKVPYKAIVPFIEHYTNPGDFVFDGFCGTGMTGVAARSSGRRGG